MIDSLIKAIKGVLPDQTWDMIYEQFKANQVKFDKPPYHAVRVSKDYMLVRVPKEERPSET